MCRSNTQAVRPALTSPLRSLRSPPVLRHSFLHFPDSTHHRHPRSCGTFPHRNTVHPLKYGQNIRGNYPKVSVVSHLSQAHCTRPCAQCSQTGSLLSPDESHCRRSVLPPAWNMQSVCSYLPVRRTDPKCALPVPPSDTPPEPSHSAPGYSKHPPHDTDVCRADHSHCNNSHSLSTALCLRKTVPAAKKYPALFSVD